MIDRSTWGYRPDGRAAIFDDGVLPEGWCETPSFLDADSRTAEALTARVERNPAPVVERAEPVEFAKPARKNRNG
ncbi:MAG: hypothetical protein ACJ8FU_08665 [Xanthobacteraceae bacterium]